MASLLDPYEYILYARRADQLGWDDDAYLEDHPFVLVEESIHDRSYYVTAFESPEDAADYHDGQEYPEYWSIVGVFHLVTGQKFFAVPHTTFEEVPD